jgi:xanthine dehydrogenase accessory factor
MGVDAKGEASTLISVTLNTAPTEADVPARQPYVSATVVQVERPTSARPGDSAVVHPDGRIDGFVGGVCAESTVRMYALQAMATGESLLLRIIPGEGESPPDGQGMVTVRNPCLSGGALQIFLQPHLPPRRVTVYGSAPIAREVAELTRHIGYEVTVCEDAEHELPAETSAVVVASLGRVDEEAVLRAVAAGVPYIGLVASPKRGSAVLSGLGLAPDDLARVHTPAGFDIGARTPGEIALSIVAQLVAALGPNGSMLDSNQRVEMQLDAGSDGAGTGESMGAPTAGRTSDVTSVATAIDPVCGMTVAAVDVTLHRDVGGAVVWFCSESCLRSFEQDPAHNRHAATGGRSRRGEAREQIRT